MRPVVVSKTGTGSTDPVILDHDGRPEISLQIVVTGTVNYTVQQTLDNLWDTTITPTWVSHPDTNLVAATATKQGNYAYVPFATRVTVNSGNGTVYFTVIQAGVLG